MSNLYSHSSKCSAINYLTNTQYTGDPRCGEILMAKRLESAKSLFRKDLYAHYGCVNAVEFSSDGEWLVSGGDDKRVLIWNMDKTLSNRPNPIAMKGEHNSNIFCLSFDNSTERLFSAGNDEQVILHDVSTGVTSDVFLHDEAVYGLSVDPKNHNLFATACDDGRVLLWDTRVSTADAFVLAGYTTAFHAVMHNPIEPKLIATANAREGVGLWDIRKPRVCLKKYGGTLLRQGAMSVRFNSSGSHILALRRRLPPVLYEIQTSQNVAQFDHKEYYNSCTMKSCCFAGSRDEYVLSGSDDFKLYMWRIPKDISVNKGAFISDAHLVMRGHRSIVNQVRYNYTYGIFASSGVEKIIKLWSTYPIGYVDTNFASDIDDWRKVYSHEEYINLVFESGQFMSHDYSHHSVQEDPRMMAFFDSLVQRDIEGWTSDSSQENSNPEFKNTCFEAQPSASSSSSTSSSSSSDEDNSEQIKRIQSRCPSGVNFNTTLCPPVATFIGDSNQTEPETQNLTSDKISQLIARKRHCQMVKSTKATLKLKRLIKGVKKQLKTHVGTTTNTETVPRPSLLNDATAVLAAVIRSRTVRRKLQKKRAQILRTAETFCVVSSSDSDSDEEESVTQSQERTEETHNFPLENGCASSENSDNASLSNNQNLTNCFEMKNEGDTHQDQATNMPPQVLIEQDSSSRPQDSNVVFFQSKSRKRRARNYRQQNANDSQDEL